MISRSDDKERIPTEHEEQREFVSWFRRTWPGVLIFATPNGGARSQATAGRLKVEGVVAGIPDLFIPAWRLWIEMKRRKNGIVSKDQKEAIKYLASVGYSCIVCKGAEDAKLQTEEFSNQHKGITNENQHLFGDQLFDR